MKKQFYNIKNYEDNTQITIYKPIGVGVFDDVTSLQSFYYDFKNIQTNNITIRINSAGGIVNEGISIFNLIKSSNKYVTTVVDGFAASIASVIFLAGHKRIMGQSTFLMIHNPKNTFQGNIKELEQQIEYLQKITDQIVQLYVANTKLGSESIIKLMDAETLISAKQALEFGFCDQIVEDNKIAASVTEQNVLGQYHSVFYAKNKTTTISNIKQYINQILKTKKLQEIKSMKIQEITNLLQCSEDVVIDKINSMTNTINTITEQNQKLKANVQEVQNAKLDLQINDFIATNKIADNLKDKVKQLYVDNKETLLELVTTLRSTVNEVPVNEVETVENKVQHDVKTSQGIKKALKFFKNDIQSFNKLFK